MSLHHENRHDIFFCALYFCCFNSTSHSSDVRHLGENAQLVVIKNAGHALNMEKPKEMYKNLKSFLIDSITPSMQGSHSNGRKVD